MILNPCLWIRHRSMLYGTLNLSSNHWDIPSFSLIFCLHRVFLLCVAVRTRVKSQWMNHFWPRETPCSGTFLGDSLEEGNNQALIQSHRERMKGFLIPRNMLAISWDISQCLQDANLVIFLYCPGKKRSYSPFWKRLEDVQTFRKGILMALEGRYFSRESEISS